MRARGTIICVVLVLAVAAVFGQTVRHPFINFDDNLYVHENPQIAAGLTLHGIRWAFTHGHASNWHPVTWLSHMLDCQLYGLWPGGHHLTNVVLHALVTILLFLVLWRMTGEFWPGALAAAVFALHPLRAESVAWVAERKDVLSGLFFVLTLGAYVEYARRPFSIARYLAVLALLALGLMTKPMLVTLPFVLLLLDYWPLGWLQSGRVLIEKIPFVLLAAGSCAVTLLAQGDALVPAELIGWRWRAANALVAYVAYLGQFFWPAGLAVLYPHPEAGLPIWQPAAAGLLLAGLTFAAALWRKQYPYLLAGWLWYLGMLVPVIGLVQVGGQAMADRYTYLPQIGLAIALVWAGTDACRRRPAWRRPLAVASALVLAALMACAWRQTAYWRDSETLWTRDLDCAGENARGLNSLGTALRQQGRIDEALVRYEKALKLDPANADAHNNLGSILQDRGRFDEAAFHYEQTLKTRPRCAEAHANLGVLACQQGRIDEAVAHYGRALEINPDFAEVHRNLGEVLRKQGRIDEAVRHYERAVEIKPQSAEGYNGLGNLFYQKGRIDEAARQYRKALELAPRYAEAWVNLGAILRAQGRLDEAIACYEKSIEASPQFAAVHYNLANVLVQKGCIDEAAAHYRRSLDLDPRGAGARQNLGGLLYRQGKAREAIAQWREGARLCPDDVPLLRQAAWALATAPDDSLRDGSEAIALAQRAVRISSGREPEPLDSLAAAYAEAGRFPEAVDSARRAFDSAAAMGNAALADALKARLELYQKGMPVRDSGR